MEGMAERMAAVTLEQEEDEEVVISGLDGDEGSVALQFNLAGKVITRKPYNFGAFCGAMNRAWMIEGLQIKQLGGDVVGFFFPKERDKCRVMESGPWCYRNSLVALRELDDIVDPAQLCFSSMPIWVQIFNLPLRGRCRKVGEVVGNKLGVCLDVDCDRNDRAWGQCLRVRTDLDFRRPIRRRMKLNLGKQMGVVMVDLKFERLPDFCFSCGLIGHMAKDCGGTEAQEGDTLFFGPELKATGFRRGLTWEAKAVQNEPRGHQVRGLRPAASGIDAEKERHRACTEPVSNHVAESSSSTIGTPPTQPPVENISQNPPSQSQGPGSDTQTVPDIQNVPASVLTEGQGEEVPACWLPPAGGTLKLNTDAGVRNGEVGCGWVVRNGGGDIVAGGTIYIHASLEPHIAECCAILQGLQQVSLLGLQLSAAESDCLQAIQTINDRFVDAPEGAIIEQIWEYLTGLQLLGVTWIRREANAAAHAAAQVALENRLTMSWGHVPLIVALVVHREQREI